MVTIRMRVSRRQKALIDGAAASLGCTRSHFIRRTVCREAEDVLRDRVYFVLPGDAFRGFTAMLDKPPKSNPKLRRLLQTRPPWER